MTATLAILILLSAVPGPAHHVAPAAGDSAFIVGAESPSPISPAKGRLLIAGRSLGDPNFAESVVLLLAYEPDGGAVGVILNRPSELRLAAVLPDTKELKERPDLVFVGGPVAPTEVLFLIRATAE